MLVVVTTIAPIFLIIVTGFRLRRTKLFPADTWPPVEHITYDVLFPSLLFVSLAAADIDNLPIGEMAVGVIGTPTIMAILLLAVRPRLTLSGPAFTSLTQGGIRFNTYIGVPLVIAFYGTDTIALGALFIGFMVPFINVVCVWVLAKYGEVEVKTRGTLGEIARNPLILSCLAGIGVNTSGLELTVPFETLFGLLGRAAPGGVALRRRGARYRRGPGGTCLGRPVSRHQADRHAADRACLRPYPGSDSVGQGAGHLPRSPDGTVGLHPRSPMGARRAADGGSPHRTDRAWDGYPAVVDFAAEGVMSFRFRGATPITPPSVGDIEHRADTRPRLSPLSAISGSYFASSLSRIPDS